MGKGKLRMTKSTKIYKFLIFYYIEKIIYINKNSTGPKTDS